MKLDPRGVEAAAYEIFDKSGFHSRKFCDRLATAALTAYFDHLKEVGLMIDAVMTWNCAVIHNGGIHMGPPNAIIIRTDKE